MKKDMVQLQNQTTQLAQYAMNQTKSAKEPELQERFTNIDLNIPSFQGFSESQVRESLRNWLG